MKTVKEMNQIDSGLLRPLTGSLKTMRLAGELGFRTARIIHRLESELPYSNEYILSQISGEKNQWSNFRKFHGDIAGRWILAMSYAHSGNDTPPEHLQSIVDHVLALQNDDGTFGCVQQVNEPLNMHKAYGNGWVLKGLTHFAAVFENSQARAAAERLGDWYVNSFESWAADASSENDSDGNYAVSRSCYFHALDGLMSLYRLTGKQKLLDLAGALIPHLTPMEEADHTHMYLTCRRGVLEYYIETGKRDKIQQLAGELQRFEEKFILETGGAPERMEQDDAVRNNPERLFTDEGCTNFDWLLLCTRLHEVTGETRWRDRALLNLENQIFFNQLDNGGFGDCEFGPYYPRLQKEAPWCCSLFGPFGFIQAASMFVRKEQNTVTVHAPLSGTFTFDDQTELVVCCDHEKQILLIVVTPGTDVQRVQLNLPFWMQAEKTELDVTQETRFEIPFKTRLWLAEPYQSPVQDKTGRSGDEKILFYGPWLLAHRFNEPIPTATISIDDEGFINGFEAESIRGLGSYGESVRIHVPSSIKTNPHDVSLDPNQHDGDLWLYPLKDKEVVWRAWSRVVLG